MIARLDRRRKPPAIVRSLTGVAPDVFDGLLAVVLTAPAAADFARHDHAGEGEPGGVARHLRVRLVRLVEADVRLADRPAA